MAFGKSDVVRATAQADRALGLFSNARAALDVANDALKVAVNSRYDQIIALKTEIQEAEAHQARNRRVAKKLAEFTA